MSDLLITSAYAVPLNGETPAEIMYMPAGTSTIRANVNGKPKQISVNVTPKTAEVLQASLATLLTEPVGPFVDFNHKGEDSAATPTSFRWDESGVLMALDWSAAGKSAIEGKTYKFLSPTFLLSESGEPSGLPDEGPIAALTNRPAFKRMRSITAAEAASTGDEADTKERTMAEQTAETVEASLRTENETLRAEIKTLKDSLETQRVEAINMQADLLIETAVQAHKIAPKDEKIKAGLKKLYLVDAEAAKAAIESLPVNPAFKTVVNVTAGSKDIGKPPPVRDPHTSNGNSGKICDAKVQAIRSQFPNMTYEEAWRKAEAEFPELFQKVEA
jgi:phage I-like protein